MVVRGQDSYSAIAVGGCFSLPRIRAIGKERRRKRYNVAVHFNAKTQLRYADRILNTTTLLHLIHTKDMKGGGVKGGLTTIPLSQLTDTNTQLWPLNSLTQLTHSYSHPCSLLPISTELHGRKRDEPGLTAPRPWSTLTAERLTTHSSLSILVGRKSYRAGGYFGWSQQQTSSEETRFQIRGTARATAAGRSRNWAETQPVG